MSDSATFEALRRTISLDHRVWSYIRKQERKANEQLNGINELLQTGSGISHDAVPHCAEALRDIVHEVGEYCTERNSQPFPTQEGRKAARLLLDLVERVLELNQDLRKGHRPRTRTSKHNLYSYLIVDPPIGPSEGRPWMTDVFVLDTLASLDYEIWDAYVPKLIDIGNRVRVNRDEASKRDAKGSQRFLAKIQSMADSSRDTIREGNAMFDVEARSCAGSGS